MFLNFFPVLSFEEYLAQKKIDSQRFKLADPHKFEEYEKIFLQVSPDSFTMQKLNVINFIRREFPLISK